MGIVSILIIQKGKASCLARSEQTLATIIRKGSKKLSALSWAHSTATPALNVSVTSEATSSLDGTTENRGSEKLSCVLGTATHTLRLNVWDVYMERNDD